MAAPALLMLAEPALSCAPVGKAPEGSVCAQAKPTRATLKTSGAMK
jgi:hypothetical protein